MKRASKNNNINVLSCSENITDCLHQFRIIKVDASAFNCSRELQDKQTQSRRESLLAREFHASNTYCIPNSRNESISKVKD